MFPYLDTSNTGAVSAYTLQVFKAMYPRARCAWLPKVFADVEALFAGRHPTYAPVDSRYHDLQHTLQAVVCIVMLFEGRRAARVRPGLESRQFELAVTAMLLHDTGFLRFRSDTKGTSAKYTYCHILRSCAFAASYMPTLGADSNEVEAVLSAINCTGPNTELSRLWFRQPADRVIGAALATADYLGQMSANNYPEKLDILYEEFRESEEQLRVPVSRRAFASARDLVEKTPLFWDTIVRPKLEREFQGLVRFLARPYPDGPNAYLAAVEANMDKIQQKIAAYPPAVRGEVAGL
jgi:hypothetical protein